MRIAVVSDTHLPRFGRALPGPLVRDLEAMRIERILHCGDWTEPLAVPLLEAVAPVDGVAGNNDGAELRERFGTRRVVEVGGVRLGIVHGHEGRASLTTRERALASFAAEPGLAAIAFGHSHAPHLERLADGRLLVNPGSPTDKRRQPRYSWALLTIAEGRVEGELRFFDR